MAKKWGGIEAKIKYIYNLNPLSDLYLKSSSFLSRLTLYCKDPTTKEWTPIHIPSVLRNLNTSLHLHQKGIFGGWFLFVTFVLVGGLWTLLLRIKPSVYPSLIPCVHPLQARHHPEFTLPFPCLLLHFYIHKQCSS